MLRCAGSPVSLAIGFALASSTAYLLALLFGHVFGVAGVQRHHVESASYIFAAAAAITAFRNTSESGSGSAAVPRRGWLMPTAGFIAASWALYGNTLSLGLFSDDFVLADRARAGRWIGDAGFVRPLPALLWAAVLSATRSATALHALNIGLHGLNAAFVCLLAQRLRMSEGAAVAAGLLFLTFPGSVEAVVWPAAVHDLLVTICAAGFLLLAGHGVSAARVVAATAVLMLGLLSKESAVAIPLLAMVLWLELPDARRTAGWPVLAAGTAVSVVYAAVRVTTVAIPDGYAVAPSRYVAKELIARPFAALAIPWSTTVLDSWPAIGYVWVLGFIAAATTYAWRTDKPVKPSTILRCLVAVLVAVLPVYSMLFITADLENARYLYLSTVFWVLAVVGLAARPAAGRCMPASWAMLGLVVAAGAAGVQWHLGAWREAARLRERVVTAAQAAIHRAPCHTVSLAGAPDSVRGAYVFRNGLAEAVALRTGFVSRSAPAECLYVWNGSTFVAASNGSVPVQATLGR